MSRPNQEFHIEFKKQRVPLFQQPSDILRKHQLEVDYLYIQAGQAGANHNSCSQQIRKLEETVLKLKQTLEETTRNKDALKKIIDSTAGQTTRVSILAEHETLASLKQHNIALRKQIQAAFNNKPVGFSMLEPEDTTIDKQISVIRNHIIQMKQKISEKQKRISQSQLLDLEIQNERLKSLIRQKDQVKARNSDKMAQTYAELKNRNTILVEQIVKSRNTLKSLQEKYNILESETNLYRQENGKLQKDTVGLSANVFQQPEENQTRLQEKYDQLKTQYQELRKTAAGSYPIRNSRKKIFESVKPADNKQVVVVLPPQIKIQPAEIQSPVVVNKLDVNDIGQSTTRQQLFRVDSREQQTQKQNHDLNQKQQ